MQIGDAFALKLDDTGQTQLVQWFLLPAKIKELSSGRL